MALAARNRSASASAPSEEVADLEWPGPFPELGQVRRRATGWILLDDDDPSGEARLASEVVEHVHHVVLAPDRWDEDVDGGAVLAVLASRCEGRQLDASAPPGA